MKATVHVRAAVVCIAVFLVRPDVRAVEKIEITGHVIARDVYLALPKISSAVSVDVFVLRINEPFKSRETSTYFLKVRYEDYDSHHPLPTDLLESKQSWRFSLKRDRSCDQVVSEGLIMPRRASSDLPRAGTYVLVQGVDVKDVPPVHSTIPCFILRPGGVERLSRQPWRGWVGGGWPRAGGPLQAARIFLVRDDQSLMRTVPCSPHRHESCSISIAPVFPPDPAVLGSCACNVTSRVLSRTPDVEVVETSLPEMPGHGIVE